MSYRKRVTKIVCFVAFAGLASGQVPVPPEPPEPPMAVAPVPPVPPVRAPRPAPAPAPAVSADAWPDLSFQFDDFSDFGFERSQEAMERAEEAMEKVREKMLTLPKFGDIRLNLDMPLQIAQAMDPAARAASRANRDESSLYRRGQNAVENRRWDEALESFSQVAARGGSRADGALYWKAYSLNKLGKRDESLAALAELRKSYGSSRWLNDAKALEVEVKQASGQSVTPESETDDEIKLLALNGLVQSDSERAMPLLERLLNGPQSPRLKQQALFVLAQSRSPRAQQLLEQLARGSGNPDLQLRAITYMGAAMRKQGSGSQVLSEIYASSSDISVKRAVLSAFSAAREKDKLLQIARTEKSPELRMEAIASLPPGTDQAELWQLYQSESSVELKQQMLHMLSRGGSERLLELARTEKDPKLRRTAIHSLAGMRTPSTSEALVSLYASEQDEQVKRAILDSLAGQNNVKAVVELARKERDPRMKREMVARLSGMKSKEADDFLMELLK